MPSVNPFYSCTAEELTALRADYFTCIQKLALNQQYTIAGRQLTRVDLDTVKETFAQIEAAIQRRAGRRVRRTYINAGHTTR